MASITCGNCKETHGSVEAVRNCYQSFIAGAGAHPDTFVMSPSHANNPMASKMIHKAAETSGRGVRFVEGSPDHLASIAKLERSFGFKTERPNTPRDRHATQGYKTRQEPVAPIAQGNRNEAGQTKIGFYKVGENIFKVTPAKSSNRTFAHLLLGALDGGAPSWEYKGLASIHVPADAPRLTVADAASYGHTHGYCMICGRLLTAEDSVAAGIGPICAGKL